MINPDRCIVYYTLKMSNKKSAVGIMLNRNCNYENRCNGTTTQGEQTVRIGLISRKNARKALDKSLILDTLFGYCCGYVFHSLKYSRARMPWSNGVSYNLVSVTSSIFRRPVQAYDWPGINISINHISIGCRGCWYAHICFLYDLSWLLQ